MFSPISRFLMTRSITGSVAASGRRILVALVPVLLLAGCAVPESERAERRPLPTDAEVEQYNARVEPEERIVCRDEISVGSNIPERKCRYVRDIQATSTFHREQLRNILR